MDTREEKGRRRKNDKEEKEEGQHGQTAHDFWISLVDRPLVERVRF